MSVIDRLKTKKDLYDKSGTVDIYAWLADVTEWIVEADKRLQPYYETQDLLDDRIMNGDAKETPSGIFSEFKQCQTEDPDITLIDKNIGINLPLQTKSHDAPGMRVNVTITVNDDFDIEKFKEDIKICENGIYGQSKALCNTGIKFADDMEEELGPEINLEQIWRNKQHDYNVQIVSIESDPVGTYVDITQPNTESTTCLYIGDFLDRYELVTMDNIKSGEWVECVVEKYTYYDKGKKYQLVISNDNVIKLNKKEYEGMDLWTLRLPRNIQNFKPCLPPFEKAEEKFEEFQFANNPSNTGHNNLYPLHDVDFEQPIYINKIRVHTEAELSSQFEKGFNKGFATAIKHIDEFSEKLKEL